MTDGDKTVAIREIKLTMNFMLPEPFYSKDMEAEYIARIDRWIASILKDFNGGFPSSEMAPLFVQVIAEDVTSAE